MARELGNCTSAERLLQALHFDSLRLLRTKGAHPEPVEGRRSKRGPGDQRGLPLAPLDSKDLLRKRSLPARVGIPEIIKCIFKLLCQPRKLTNVEILNINLKLCNQDKT